MWEHLIKHLAHELFESGLNAGLKKVSELSGSKAKQLGAATQVADQFLSAVKNGVPEAAKAYCNASFLTGLGDKGLEALLSGLDLRSVTWEFTTVDDSFERNKWGKLNDVNLIGRLIGIKIGNDPKGGDAKLSLRVLKEDEGWKILGMSLF